MANGNSVFAFAAGLATGAALAALVLMGKDSGAAEKIKEKGGQLLDSLEKKFEEGE